MKDPIIAAAQNAQNEQSISSEAKEMIALAFEAIAAWKKLISIRKYTLDQDEIDAIDKFIKSRMAQD